MKLWIVERKNTKIVRDHLCEWALQGAEWTAGDLEDALTKPCQALDVSRPIVLDKHVIDMNRCGRAVFRRAEFMDAVSFDSLEIESLPEEGKERSKPRHMYSEL